MATKAELYVKYHLNPPTGKQLLAPEVPSATTVVVPYVKWIKNKCKCCGKPGVTGLWACEFPNYTAHYFLCATCGLRGAFEKWTGFFSPKLLHVDLLFTITYPTGNE